MPTKQIFTLRILFSIFVTISSINGSEQDRRKNAIEGLLMLSSARIKSSQVQRFTTKSVSFANPIILQKSKEDFICKICGRVFSGKGYLTMHERTHKNKPEYTCALCKKRFLQQSKLKNHIDGHLGVKKFKCEICKRDFTQKSSVTRHMLMHTGERPYSCEICHKPCRQISNLVEHKQTHVNKEQPSNKAEPIHNVQEQHYYIRPNRIVIIPPAYGPHLPTQNKNEKNTQTTAQNS